MTAPKLSRRRQRELREQRPLSPQLGKLTGDQCKLLLFLKLSAETGNLSPSTQQVAESCHWDLRHAVDVLRQARALGVVLHEMDGPGKHPEPVLLDVLQRYGLQSALDEASQAQLDALVLIEQGVERLPPPERAGFLLGCGLQELREQGHSPEEIRKLVNEFLDREQKTTGTPN